MLFLRIAGWKKAATGVLNLRELHSQLNAKDDSDISKKTVSEGVKAMQKHVDIAKRNYRMTQEPLIGQKLKKSVVKNHHS